MRPLIGWVGLRQTAAPILIVLLAVISLALRYYTAARWPVPNSSGKQRAYLNALAAFRNYGRLLDPPVEILHIPFEGKEIPGYIRLPKEVRPAPVVLMINGPEPRKEDEVQGRAAMFRSGIARRKRCNCMPASGV